MMKKQLVSLLLFLFCLAGVFAAGQQEKVAKGEQEVKLIVWHDKGKKGINIFNDIGAAFQRENPNVTVESVSFDTQTFIQKSIASIISNSAPDLLYNDWFRLIPVELQTNKLIDLSADMDKTFLDNVPKVAIQMGYYNDKQIAYPHEISQIALGIRTSWLKNVGGQVPATFDDFIKLGKLFTFSDPDGNGKNDTFGFSGYFGKGVLEILRYFTLAAGLNDLVLNAEGEPSFNEAKRKNIVRFLASLYNKYEIVPKDAVSHTYIEMYQLIEGDKLGMFRCGNWNVQKWDELFKGDYQITNWPVMNAGDTPTQQLYTMRGCAVPANSPHKDVAVKFIKFGGELEGQEAHYKYNLSFARSDLRVSDISENQKYFFEEIYKPQYKMMAPDVHTSKYKYAPKIEELYERELQKIMIDPKADVDAIIAKAEKEALKVIKMER